MTIVVDITDSAPRATRAHSAKRGSPHLFAVLDAQRPLRPAEQHKLDVDTVHFGRAAAAGARRAERSLALGIPDRLCSLAHAKLELVFDNWVLEDLGSKNGTRVNGEVVTKAVLDDGDLIELGNTFFIFREEFPEAAGLAIPEDGLRTFHPGLAAALNRVGTLAGSRVALVIRGESGTGKEVVARRVHELSGRAGPFQAINCAALPAALIESELFGHRKGAFSGAAVDRKGLIAVADGGTLFLDEIGDLPAPAQVALLRVLQESMVHPLGAPLPQKLDLRVISATHRDLDALVVQEKFRADLLARLTGDSIELPPLAERREDLGTLIAAILRRLLGPKAEEVRLNPEAARALLRYRWPLNVRELEKCLETAVVLAQGEPVVVAHLPPVVAEALLDSRQGDARRGELLALLQKHHGNVTEIAAAMGKARMQIQRWLKRYGLDAAAYRD